MNNLEKILQIFKDIEYEFLLLQEASKDDICKIDTLAECKNDKRFSGGLQLTLVSIVNNQSD